MTTPNSETKGAITEFKWKKFPLEEDSFFICLVQSGKIKSKEFSDMYEYIKIVFPQKTTKDGKNKYTSLYENITPHWADTHSIFKKYLHKNHIIFVDEFQNIPDTVLTNSRIIIFESIDDTNKYLKNKHSISLDKFNEESNFIVIDKSNMGCFNISSLPKEGLIRYNKDFRPFE